MYLWSAPTSIPLYWLCDISFHMAMLLNIRPLTNFWQEWVFRDSHILPWAKDAGTYLAMLKDTLPSFPSYLPSFLYRSGCLSSIIFSAYNISFIIFANLLLKNSLSFCLPEILIYLYFSIIFEEYFVDMGFSHCVYILFNVDYICNSCLNYLFLWTLFFSQLRIIFSHFFACLVNFILSWALWILRYRKSRLLLFFHLKGVEFCSGRQFIYWKNTLISLGLILFYFLMALYLFHT